jgi:hypothetical protein
MAKNINGIAAGAAGIGLLFIWSGLKGASILATLQDVIQGKKPAGQNAHEIAVAADGGAAGDTGSTPGGDSGAHGGTAAQNQAIAKMLTASYGWNTGSNWDSLVKLWNQESSWNANAVNKSSGAYGIPQALGHGHPYSLGDASAQIKWGLDYIKQRYGTPDAAWAHEVAHNWY